MEQLLCQKAIHTATSETFLDPKIQAKVNNALQKTFKPAFDDVLADTRPLDGLARVEDFTKK